MSITVKTLIFDLDGTLINSSRDIATAVNATLRALKAPMLPPETIFGFIGNGIELLINRSLGMALHGNPEFKFPEKYIQDSVRILRDNYRRYMLQTTDAYPGIREILPLLYRNYCLGVITNKPLFYSEKLLKHLDLRKYFCLVYGADSFPEKKPHPLPLIKALQTLGTAPDQTLMIGDSAVDIQMGKAAGTLTCSVTWGLHNKKELSQYHPDFIIDTPEELLIILNNK